MVTDTKKNQQQVWAYAETKEELKVLAVRLKLTFPEVIELVTEYYLDNHK